MLKGANAQDPHPPLKSFFLSKKCIYYLVFFIDFYPITKSDFDPQSSTNTKNPPPVLGPENQFLFLCSFSNRAYKIEDFGQ